MTHASRAPARHPGSPRAFRNVPFEPGRLPFFYGWAIVAVGTLGMLTTAPGQTVGVSVFTDHLIEELGITRSALSLAYLLGTAASALLLGYAGRLYDRFGGRLTATAASGALALVLVGLTWAPAVADAVGGGAWSPFVVISVGFFLLRFSGQGMLGLSSRNMAMEWGLAMSVMVAGTALGPYLFSLGRDLTGGYAAPAMLCGGLSLLLLLGATKADRPA